MSYFKELRERAGLTQIQLAAALNVSQSTVSQWETGAALPTTDKLPKLAEILGCRIDDLFREGGVSA